MRILVKDKEHFTRRYSTVICLNYLPEFLNSLGWVDVYPGEISPAAKPEKDSKRSSSATQNSLLQTGIFQNAERWQLPNYQP